MSAYFTEPPHVRCSECHYFLTITPTSPDGKVTLADVIAAEQACQAQHHAETAERLAYEFASQPLNGWCS